MTAVRPAHGTLKLAGAVAGVSVRSVLLPRHAHRRRGRAQVCGAARILTALGVRVQVVCPDVAWPRTGGLLAVSGAVSWVDRLAVLTAVPRTVDGWAELAATTLPRSATGVPVRPGGSSTVLLPVSVLHRLDGAGALAADRVPRDLPGVLGTHGLVIEVHLLPALDAGAVVPVATRAP